MEIITTLATKPETDAVTVTFELPETDAAAEFVERIAGNRKGLMSAELRARFEAVETTATTMRVVWATSSVNQLLGRAMDAGAITATVEEGWLVGDRPEGATPMWYC